MYDKNKKKSNKNSYYTLFCCSCILKASECVRVLANLRDIAKLL